jgi:membrane-associated phospholipid phosphatase
MALTTVHFLLLVGMGGMVWFWSDAKTGIRGFLRHLYAPLLYTLFYSETAVAIHWLFPGFLDSQIVAFEQRLLGVDPNIWIIPYQTPVLNEWMMLGYFSYYLLVPVLALILFFRRSLIQLGGFLTASTIAFVISYMGFVVYPIEGPRYFLADFFASPLEGWIFVPLVQAIIENGAVHGGCMPSSHVAVAWVALIWAWRTDRRMGKILTPFVLTLFVSTVWGRFHYLTDVIVGWFVGTAALWLAERWCTSVAQHSWFQEIDANVRLKAVPRAMGHSE